MVESAAAPKLAVLQESRLIRNVVFDIGWVFLHLNYRPILELLGAHGAEAADMESLLARISFDDHETGRLHGHGLLERLAGLATQPVAHADIHAKWVDMFELQPEMVALAHRLTDRYRVYLLSNIGDLHWAHISREFRLHHIGHGALPSYLAGVMKPHEGIYIEAERRFALEPAETVFIDDRAENIAAARARGWHGIVHSGHDTTVTALRALQVEC
ncbi:MAG: putative superfamily hydrolase [Gammaproteobacteria bacterium]|nr:putative superfamily hydrolase [Gammaproteobacteria bacterium]